MDLRIGIIDDLEQDSSRLSQDIRFFFSHQLEQNTVVNTFSSGEEFLRKFHAEGYDLLFLDIYMSGMNGIELAHKIRLKDPVLLIVFLTTSKDHAFEAFPVHAFDYLIKPYSRERVLSVLKEALRVLSVRDKRIEVRVAHDTYEIPLRKIVSVTAEGHTVHITLMGQNPVRSIMTFAEIEKMLTPDPRFLVCNRGVLINMDLVHSFCEDRFLMEDGSCHPLRVRNRAALVKAFTQYSLSRIERSLHE